MAKRFNYFTSSLQTLVRTPEKVWLSRTKRNQCTRLRRPDVSLCRRPRLRKSESRWRWNVYPERAYTRQCVTGEQERCGMKRALAWVLQHGRTNCEHPPPHPPRFLLPRTRERPFAKPNDSPVPLSLARTTDLSQAFRRLNGVKRHTGAHLPVILNSMHLRAETFPPHLTSLGPVWQVKRDWTHVSRRRAVKFSESSKDEVLE